MALTLDGSTMLPNLGGDSKALEGGILGLIAGMLLTNNGNGLFGGNNNNCVDPAFQALQTQLTGLANTVDSNRTDGEIENVARSLEAANLANLQGIAANALTYQSGNASLMTEIANGNFTTLNSINNLGRDITAAETQALINNIQNFNNLSNQVTSGHSQIIAGQSAHTTALAQCCCAIEKAIAADGGLTRALINDTNMQNLRDQLNAANNKVSNNDQNQYLISTLLAHARPPFGPQ